MAVSVYDAREVHIIFGLAGQISGYVDGSFVSINKNENTFTSYVGVDGEVARALNCNQMATITINLLHTSASNFALYSMHLLDQTVGAGIYPLLILDNNGLYIFEATKAWIVRPPESGYDREVSGREWTIETDRLLSVKAKQ